MTRRQQETPTPCPACGTPAAGAFCTECGAAVSGRSCPACRAALPTAAAFCPGCGVGTRGTASTSRISRWSWRWMGLAAGVLLVAGTLASLSRRAPRPTPVVAAEAGPPDLSTMSPREQFDRLYNRVMAASEAGDTLTVATFGAMALLAYGQLDRVDADARYHAALLRLHTGDTEGAGALADTILAGQPAHLFGWLIRGMVARWTGDSTGQQASYAEVRRVWEAEMRAGRPEYADHQRMLDSYYQVARGAGQ